MEINICPPKTPVYRYLVQPLPTRCAKDLIPSLDPAAIVTLNKMATSGMVKFNIATALDISRASVYEHLKQ